MLGILIPVIVILVSLGCLKINQVLAPPLKEARIAAVIFDINIIIGLIGLVITLAGGMF